MKYHLLFAGCTGVGKSSVIEELKKMMNENMPVYVFSDPYIDNPFIQTAYSLGQRNFQSQMFFFKEFLRIQQQIDEINEGVILQERSVYECVNIFCRQYLEENKFDRDEFRLFSDLLDLLSSKLKKPDAFIYVFASAPTILSRIQKRGRSFESSLNVDFVNMQSRMYEEWVKTLDCKNTHSVLKIDSENKNAVECATEITKMLQNNKF